jgi:hypothetical protein
MSSLKYAFIIICLFTLSNCAVTSEKYRYQQRLDHFYRLLNTEEKKMFGSNELGSLGKSLEKRLSENSNFIKEFKKVQFTEAINTFDGYQTVHFFRETILKELNRPNFYRFMEFLSAEEQISFVRQEPRFIELFTALTKKNTGFLNFMNNLKREYRFTEFSDKQIIDFFRSTSFPEVSRIRLFPLLKLLKSAKALEDFGKGNIEAATKKLDGSIKQIISLEIDFSRIKRDSSISKVSTYEFLDLYYRVILKEMDPYAVYSTIDKF